MTGNLVNTVAILIGGLVGLAFKSRISERFSNIMVEAIGLGVMIYGISQGITTENPLVLFSSIALGSLIGEFIDIEKKLSDLGDFFQNRMKNATGVTQGFVTSSLLFCVGAMAIMGGLQGGLQGEHDILFAKAFLDGVMSVIFASALGVGVLLSAGSVFLYQGTIVLLSGFLKSYLAAGVVTEMTAVGGVLIFAIGINLLKIKHLKLGNMLPAVFIPILINLFYTL